MTVPWWGLALILVWTGALGVLAGYVTHWWAESRADLREQPPGVYPGSAGADTLRP